VGGGEGWRGMARVKKSRVKNEDNVAAGSGALARRLRGQRGIWRSAMAWRHQRRACGIIMARINGAASKANNKNQCGSVTGA